jgi:O-antigen ligase
MTFSAQGPVKATGPRPAPWLGALVQMVLLLTLAILFTFFLGSELWRYRTRSRGLENGLAAEQAPMAQPRLGANVALERYADESALRQALRRMQGAGLGTLRQRFAWQEMEPAPGDYHWDRWDWVLPLVPQEGLSVIAVLDTSPAWAREGWEADNPYAPPRDVADYANFAGALAERYGRWISAYQIWDEPNIAPHWGNRPIDPAAYVALLSAASAAIRQADPDAVIIAGGMAPNLETGGRNMSDVQFLHEIYRLGAGQWFDVLGIKAYGFWSGPYDRRVDEGVLNLSRAILLREEMVRRGENSKAIWALDGGWCALPEDWQGMPSPQGSDTPQVQADRSEYALQRTREEWPWMGLFLIGYWQPLAPEDDPLWGYALLDRGGQATILLERLERRRHQDDTLYPGFTPATQLPDPQSTSNPFSLSFWGTDAHLLLRERPGDPSWTITIDGHDIVVQPEDITQEAGSEHSPLWRVRVARRLAPQVHGLQIGATPTQLTALEGIQVGHRPSLRDLWLALLGGALILSWLGVALVRTARMVPWREGWSRVSRWWAGASQWVQVGSVAAPFVVLMAWPSPVVRSACLLVYSLASLLRPDLALAIAVASIPTRPLMVDLPKGSFSLTELALLVAVAARLWNVLLHKPQRERPPAKMHWSVLDIAVLALVLWGLGSSFMAEYSQEAFREWRTVVLESAVLYGLLRTWDERTWGTLQLTDVLWLSAVALSVYSLVLYPLPSGVIEAEGVRRARAFYGSPNNVALYLDRLLPLGLAVAGWGQTRWRRWFYGLGCIPVALVILLTYSRGAWFLGVPAGLLFLAWVRGGRMRWLALALVGVGLAALATVASTERIASLLDFTSGTTFLRISLWRASWEMLKDHFWLGVGLDNFLYYYGDYIRAGAEVDRWLSHPHNIVFDFGLRLGVGGVALLLTFLIGFFRSARQAYRASTQKDRRAMLLGITAGMVAVLAHGLIDSAFFLAELALWFMFALAWVQGRARRAAITDPVPSPPRPSDSEAAYP